MYTNREVGAMEKRTTIYLDDEDQAAIEVIRDHYKARGIVRMTASAAIRLALRETSQRLTQEARRRQRTADRES
jgi:hypothetical protein